MPAPIIDIQSWECTLRTDKRIDSKARLIAHVLAEQFRRGDGQCQMSVEGIAAIADVVNVQAVRDAMAMLRLAGSLISERVENTQHKGMMHRPVLPATQATMHEL